MTRGQRTPATFTLLALILATFGLEFLIGPSVVWRFAVIPEAIKGGQVWRLITGTFLHAGLLHLLVNSVSLFQLGRFFEIMFGTRRFLLVYFASGLAGALASTFINSGPSVGASGAIFGILGALILAVRQSPVWRNHRTARSIAGQCLVMLLINLVITWQVPQIDKAGHIGGLVVGLLLGWLLPHRTPPLPPARVVVDVMPYEESPAGPEGRRDDRSWPE